MYLSRKSYFQECKNQQPSHNFPTAYPQPTTAYLSNNKDLDRHLGQENGCKRPFSKPIFKTGFLDFFGGKF